MQMARAWKIMLRSALLVALGASTAHAAVTNVYYEDFESWSNGVGIAAQDPTHWTNWTWTGDALVTSTLDANSNATKALDVQGRDMNLYLPARLFDGVTSNSAATDDATRVQISMDVWLVQDDILDFMISDYQRPPTNFDYYDHPGSGFEISGTDGYGPSGANGFYGAAGPHGNILTFISFGTYLGWGFDYFHKDYDPGVKGGAWHHVLMDMKLDPTSIDASGDMTVYTQWWLNGTNLFANGYPSADRSYTGVPVAGSEGSNVWSGAYSKINASAFWGTGGVQSAEIFGWVGQSNVFVDNISIKQGYYLAIEQSPIDTCGMWQTNAWLNLIAGSYWGTGGVSWTYTNSAGLSAGLSNVNFSSTNYFYFNPSNSTPGMYVVTAQAVGMTNYQSVATVNVFRVQITPTNAIVCWHTDFFALSLTNSYWGTNGIVWSGTNGLGVTSVTNDRITFAPSNSVPTNYVITATMTGFTNCNDTTTLVVVDTPWLLLTNAISSNSVIDTTLMNEPAGVSNTLYIGETDASNAVMQMLFNWSPTNVSGNCFRWKIELTNGSPTTQWGVTNSAGTWLSTSNSTFVTNPVTLIWTNILDATGLTNREFVVTAWFDSNTNGIYETNEIHRQLYVSVLKVDLDVDTDRDGIVDDNDEPGKDQWTVSRGSFAPPAITNDLSSNMVACLAPIIVRTTGVVSNGYGLRLYRPIGNESLTILDSTGRVIMGDSGEYYDLACCYPFTNGVTYYGASSVSRSSGTTNAFEYVLSLQTTDPWTNVICSDIVKLKLAPMILPWEGDAVERVYVTTNFPENVTNIPNLVRIPDVALFVQDYVKLAKVQIAATNILDVVADRGVPFTFEAALCATGEMYRVHWNMTCSGGNVMTTPPLPDAPYGKVIVGDKNLDAEPYLSGQGIQTNVITKIPTSWLSVGHVDEVIMFIDTNTVLIPDPWIAANIMHNAITNGNGTNTIRHGEFPTGTCEVTYLDLVVALNSAGAYKFTELASPGMSATTNSMVLTNALFEVDDFVRVDDELMRVTSTNGCTSTVIRAKAGTTNVSHSAGTKAYALTTRMRWNLPIDDPCVYTNLVNVTKALSTALAPYTVNYVKLPVLFEQETLGPTKGFFGGTANVVNSLVYPGQGIYMQTTGNVAFDSYVSNHVSSVQFVDIWDNYHVSRGELHCGSLTRRTIDFSTPWWVRMPNWR